MTPHTKALRTAALLMLFVSAPTNATIQLSFGLYTSNKPTSMVRQFRPVLDLMQAQLQEILNEPVEIRMQVARDYSQGINHLASGKVDFSRFGPASYIEAKRANEGLRILAVEREGGDKVFYGVIAVSKDSPITAVEQLRGKSFAFGNDQSTIGRYLSQQYLRHHGIFSGDLSRFDYLGRHDTVGTSVGAGHFDAGALNESTFTKLVAKGVAIRELARFPNVTKPWIAREGLPERLFEALRESLLNLSDPLLQKSLKVDGFVPGNDDDFEDIRASIEKNSLFFEPGSARASADEKATASQEQSSESNPEELTVESTDSIVTKESSSGIAGPQEPAPFVGEKSGSVKTKSTSRTSGDTAESQRAKIAAKAAPGVDALEESIEAATPVPARSESTKEPSATSPAEADSAGVRAKSPTPPAPPESTAFSAPAAASVDNEEDRSQDVEAPTTANKPETDKSVSTTPVAPSPRDSQSHPATPAPNSGPLQTGQSTADRLLEARADSANSSDITAPLHGRDGTSRLQ